MNRTLRLSAVILILLVLHFTVRPLLDWHASIDFLVIALLLVSVRVRPGTAAVIGFGLGLVADALVLQAFGASALAMSLIGYAAAWLKAVFFADNVVLNTGFFFVGKLVYDVLYLVSERRLGGGELALELLVWSPLRALLTAGAGLLVLSVLRPVLRGAEA